MIDYKAMEKEIQNKIKTDDKVDYYTWPGAYPLYYIPQLCDGVLCPKCVNENIDLVSDPDDPQWYIIGYDVNYEDESLYCDHCGEQIESAYGEENEKE